MLIVVRGQVKHDGRTYVSGEALPKIDRKDEIRLLDLGVCIEGGTPEPIKELPQEPPQDPPVDPILGSAGLNLDFNPDDSIKGKA